MKNYIICGGSWYYNHEGICLISFRNDVVLNFYTINIGFRITKTPKQ